MLKNASVKENLQIFVCFSSSVVIVIESDIANSSIAIEVDDVNSKIQNIKI